MIEADGIVALPTDTLYGLAVNPFHAGAVARVFAAKGRAAERALLLIAADVEQIERHIGPLSFQAQRLASAFWPGPLTLIMSAPATLAAGVASPDGTVGVRVPAHTIARELCRACGVPLTATSANLSGDEAPSRPADVERSLSDRIDSPDRRGDDARRTAVHDCGCQRPLAEARTRRRYFLGRNTRTLDLRLQT